MDRNLLFEKDDDLSIRETDLRLGLPGSDEPEKPRNNKRASAEKNDDESITASSSCVSNANGNRDLYDPPPKVQAAGWPPIRSYRTNCLEGKKHEGDGMGKYVKVSVDGAPYLRKIDLKIYKTYSQLLKSLEKMFKLTIGEYSEREGYSGSEYAPAYKDKDGDWMLVGDVPWDMFASNCKRLRIMKGIEATGFACV